MVGIRYGRGRVWYGRGRGRGMVWYEYGRVGVGRGRIW